MLQLKETESTPWHLVSHLPPLRPSPTNHDQNLDPRLRLEAWPLPLTCCCHLTSNLHSAWQPQISNLDLSYPLLVRSIAMSTVDPGMMLLLLLLPALPLSVHHHEEIKRTTSIIEAPHHISCVMPQNDTPHPGGPHLTQQPLHLSLWEDHRQSTTLEVPSLQLEEPANLPSLHREELNNPDFPPSCPTGLWHTASFYDTPFDGVRLHGHTLFVTPTEDKDHDPAGEGNYSDTPINETTPSEDDCFAESVLWGDNAHMHMQSQACPLFYTEYSGQGEYSSDTNDVVAAHQQ
ncbi:hypothetical protein EDC04DRAFT_1262076 [Pisolithus marmoratus]|nr:hypothetical protein EDC04DRAFT_1262076 [Pisolithus marmoratus]